MKEPIAGTDCTIDFGGWDKALEQLDGEREIYAAQIAAWVVETFGERCPDFCEGCECCERWAAFDRLFKPLYGVK